jgi:hypothetical protein
MTAKILHRVNTHRAKSRAIFKMTHLPQRAPIRGAMTLGDLAVEQRSLRRAQPAAVRATGSEVAVTVF